MPTDERSHAGAWERENQRPLGEPLTGHSDSVSSIVFSPDGQILASGSSDDTVRLWDIANQKVLGWPLTGHSATVRSVAFSPNGQTLASGGDDNTVRLWNVATQQLLGEPLVSHLNSVKQVAFSPDGQILASMYSDNTVRLWNIATRQPLELPLTGYSDRVGNVAFTPNAPASARSWYDTIKLLGTNEPQRGQLFGKISQLGLVSSIAFSPDGQTIASGSWDNTVIFWDTNPESWLKQLCVVANRNPSQTEWHQYMGERPHEKTCPDLPEDTLGALQSIQQGKELAREGKIKAAVKKFQLAQTLDTRFVTFDLQAQAQHFAALGLVEQGKKLAQEGQVKSAIAKIKAAQALDSSLNFVPETKVREFVARGLVRQGEDLAGKGKIEAAIAKYQAAQQLDMKVNITAGQWDDLCWYGSVYGQAANVLKFCEQAVVLVPYDGNIRDSQALAKALTGDIPGAIADFQFAIDKLDDKELKKRRRSWVNALKQGENPFTKEVLKGLR
jgi:tetratricopeptide (TPR) repeat protein